MLAPKSTIAVTPRIIVLVLSCLCLLSAAIFGLVGSYRVDVLRTDLASANAARDAVEHRETELKTREAAVAGAEAKIAEAEKTATEAQAELLKLQKEKAELEGKLDALQKQIGEAGPAASPSQNPGTASKPQQPATSGPSVEIAQEPVEEATPPPPSQPKRRKIAPRKEASTSEITSYASAKPFATFTPLPKYPARERTDSVTGVGVCLVSVDPASGRVTTASMEQSTGDSTLDKSAVNAFGKWRFKPGTVSKVRIPIEFNMPSASQ
jgi:TonB family C-terminal domain